jgi:hypothetical protein
MSVRLDKSLEETGSNVHAQTIRECFGWREIPASPDFMMRVQRRLTDCGFEAGRPDGAALKAGHEDGFSESMNSANLR